MDKNLEWLTQNNEDLKSNKGNLTPTLRNSIFRRSYPPWNKVVWKILVKFHERCMWVSLLLKLQVMELFWKWTLSQLFLKKSGHGFNWLLLWIFFFLNNLFFTLVVIVISKNKQEFLKFYVSTQFSITLCWQVCFSL